jgi:Lipoprotein LpqB beta-propeller domain/Sporulation and spore germination
VARARPLLAVGAALLAAVFAAGCVSMPTGGPVLSYPVTQGPDAQNQPYIQVVPQPPRPGWSPAEIVEGFLSASASFGDYKEVAKEYLTPQYQTRWTRSWSATVYKSGPDVKGPATLPASAKATVTVQVTGQAQAYLQSYGSYSVPSASAPDQSSRGPQQFQLTRVGHQWRISHAPTQLLLTSDSFANDYQLRNLYFFDPTGQRLVPDPVYVPLQDNSEDLMNGLVHDLISPPADWLSLDHATRSALPADTKIRKVAISGVTAVVNLAGSIAKATPETMQQISAQLLRTLADTEQTAPNRHAVQSVEVQVDGKAWTPPGQGNPVQPARKTTTPHAQPFYYVDSAGYLNSRLGAQGKPARGLHIGTGASAVAVSPDSRFLAVLRGGTLYTGLIAGPLTKRGAGYQSISWDANDDLWASVGDQLFLFRGSQGSKQALSQRAVVGVADLSSDAPFTALRVAPDGVRVAIVVGGDLLRIGAISGGQGPSPQITLSQVQLKPLNGASMFTGLSWYGQDNVITLATPGPALTEYPVSGSSPSPVSIPVDSGIKSISASLGSPLIASLAKGRMVDQVGASLTNAWSPLGSGNVPTYPG